MRTLINTYAYCTSSFSSLFSRIKTTKIWKWCWFNKLRRKRGEKANGRHEVRKRKEVGMKETNGSETNSKNKGKTGERGKWSA
jgi:hypothetical protein